MQYNQEFRRRWLKGWLIFEVIALIIAFVSAGGGHGKYLFVKLLFPIPMYFGVMHHVLDALMLILLLVQYPAIGLIPFVATKRRSMYIYALLAALHVIFVVITFLEDGAV